MSLSSSREHGDPVEHPETGFRVCRKCHERYRWSSETGEYDREPYGACSGLRRGNLERGKGVNQRNPERIERRRTSEGVRIVYGEYYDWCSDRSCCACGDHPCVPHHVTSVGAGGTDPANLADLCQICHTDVHREGAETWQREHGIDLEERAEALWRTFLRRRPKLGKRLEDVA